MDTPKTLDSARTDLANIGKSVVIKGELSGSEDLYLDGQVEGSIEMAGNRLPIGPNGKGKANVTGGGSAPLPHPTLGACRRPRPVRHRACRRPQALTIAATGPPPDGPWCTAA